MQNDPGTLAIKAAIDQAGTIDVDGQSLAGGPTNQVSQKPAMIGQVVLGKTAVEVGGWKSGVRSADRYGEILQPILADAHPHGQAPRNGNPPGPPARSQDAVGPTRQTGSFGPC